MEQGETGSGLWRMAQDNESDCQLLEGALGGDEGAFVALYRRWQGNIYRFSLRLSGSSSIAEDVTQEVFLALVNGAARFDAGQGLFSSYLYGIARNHVLRRLTRERIYAPLADNGEEDGRGCLDVRHIPSDLLGNLVEQERIESLHRAIAALPLRYREPVVLCDLQELGYAAAAQVIGCPEGTIRSRLHRARILLLERLREMAMESSRGTGIEAARCLS
jgi:RNA polymerase sigma-70 factor, ECF subfamily